jgi:hypothetical protein
VELHARSQVERVCQAIGETVHSRASPGTI